MLLNPLAVSFTCSLTVSLRFVRRLTHTQLLITYSQLPIPNSQLPTPNSYANRANVLIEALSIWSW